MSTTTTTTTTTTTSLTNTTPSAIPIKTITPPNSHYKTLNLPPTCSGSDIRTAFHHLVKLAQQPGPSHIPNFTSSQRFKDLKEAYDTLSDAESRKKYDINLAKEGGREMGEKLGRELKGKGERGVVRNVNVRGEEVYEGRGEERVVKWTGRPRGPRVAGSNV